MSNVLRPYTNVPEHLQDKMDKCVKKVMGQGHDKESAIAICYTSIVEREEERMTPLQKLWEGIKRAFSDAGVNVAATAAESVTRVIAASQLFSKVYDLLRELNLEACYIGEDGYVYIDWDTYLSPMDLYYDDDGSLFLLCTRAGKLYRIPVQVNSSAAADGEEVALGAPVEVPLTGRRVQSRFSVVRDAAGKLRWYAIAASSVLNRVGEIDSRELFDSFVAHATETGEYPLLSFYHLPEQIRFGVADFLARDENLYLAAGTFDENDIARAAAEGLLQSTDEWGTSIGFLPISEPALLRVGEVNIPVYTRGINSEISIVLEREAAAHFTSIGTKEVERSMEKTVYDRLVALVGKERADALAAQTDETNRAIAAQGMITREANETEDGARVTTATTSASGTNAVATTVTAEAQPPAATETPAQERELVLDEETLATLADALTARLPFQALQDAVNANTNALAQLTPRMEQMENAQRSISEATLTQIEERLAALELDDETRHTEWVQDLPPQRTVITLRPREARAVQVDENGNPIPPTSQELAANTLAGMKSKRNGAHA